MIAQSVERVNINPFALSPELHQLIHFKKIRQIFYLNRGILLFIILPIRTNQLTDLLNLTVNNRLPFLDLH